MERYAALSRKTKETEVSLEFSFDGGEIEVSTGVGFFDHMLTAFAVHGGFGLKLKTVGDWHVDCHHTIEDTGIVLGKAFAEALGSKRVQPVWACLHPYGQNIGIAAAVSAGVRFWCPAEFPRNVPVISIPA